jgi:hypothetical protein
LIIDRTEHVLFPWRTFRLVCVIGSLGAAGIAPDTAGTVKFSPGGGNCYDDTFLVWRGARPKGTIKSFWLCSIPGHVACSVQMNVEESNENLVFLFSGWITSAPGQFSSARYF